MRFPKLLPALSLSGSPGKGVATLLLACAPAFPQAGLGRWISTGNAPNARGEIGGAVVGDKLYVLGGIGGPTGGYREAFVYTPADRAWRPIAPMPVGLHHPNVGAMGGKLYVLGGCDHGPLGGNPPNGSPWLGSKHSLVYDPALDRWTRIKPVPRSTAAGGVAAWGSRLYVIGGVDTNGIVHNAVQEYDPGTDAWRERAGMPTAREHIGVAALDSLIYVVAGRLKGLGGESVRTFEAYSPASDTWVTLPNLPTSRSGLAFAAAKGRLYAMGGEWPGHFDVNEEFDPAKKTWRTVTRMPAARHGFVALTYQDSVYAIGARSLVETFLPPETPTRIGIPDSEPAARRPSRGILLDILGRRYPGGERPRPVLYPASLPEG